MIRVIKQDPEMYSQEMLQQEAQQDAIALRASHIEAFQRSRHYKTIEKIISDNIEHLDKGLASNQKKIIEGLSMTGETERNERISRLVVENEIKEGARKVLLSIRNSICS